MKRLFITFILSLTLFMVSKASSNDGREENQREVHLRHGHQNIGVRGEGRTLANFDPRNWTSRTKIVACFGVICGIFLLQNYMVARMETNRCMPKLDSQIFKRYNAEHNTDFSPSEILGQGGAHIGNNPFLPILDDAFRENMRFLYNLVNTTLNRTHLQCQYDSVTNYRYLDQSCPDASTGYRDESYDLTYNVSPFYNYWHAYSIYSRLFTRIVIPYCLVLYYLRLI